MSSRHAATCRRTRALPLVWAACAVSAVVLGLGVSGTLSSWTTAIINNSSNTALTTTAVILREVGLDGASPRVSQTCLSATNTSNSYSCTSINKYGGSVVALTPGGATNVSDVVFTNVGGANASTFVLTTAGCTQTPTAGTGSPPVNNVCTNGDLSVAISCSLGSTYAAGSAWTDLVYAAGAPSSIPATLTHTTGLAAGASATCRFTVALSVGASPLSQGVTVSQALTWTLNQ